MPRNRRPPGWCRPWLLDGRAARAEAARMPGSNPGAAAVLAVLCQDQGRAAARLVVLLVGSWRITQGRGPVASWGQLVALYE